MTVLETPDAPLDAWLEAVHRRVSRRAFDGAAVEPALLDKLEAFVSTSRPVDLARVVVIREVPQSAFRGVIGAYGRVSGAPSALAFIGTAGTPGVDECVGYAGEAAVLEACRLGLDTCWIAGTFRSGPIVERIELASGERVFAISPLGNATPSPSFAERTVLGHRSTGSKPRMSAQEIAPGSGQWPGWARAGVEAARLAPSAMNKQPWRFSYADGRVTVSYAGPDAYKLRVSKRLDCGIAMLHFEIAARHAGGNGYWELLTHRSDVARYVLA